MTKSDIKPLYISDYKLIFDEDTSLETPYLFEKHSVKELSKIKQTHVNQVPCAMSGFTFNQLESQSFTSMIGYASNKDKIGELVHQMNKTYLHEKELENKILENIKTFLLELGGDFCFLGNQYKLKLGEDEYFIDLLFYHRELKCLFAIELKTIEFKPEMIGKMNFYLEILDDTLKKKNENS